MNRSTPGLPVHHQLLEFTQTHVHRVSDAIQPSHPRSSPFPPAPNPSQHQSLSQWVNSLHEVAKVLEFQLQHQSFQWTPRTGLFRRDCLDLHAGQGTLKSLLQHHSSKTSILWHSDFLTVQLSHPYMTTGKIISSVHSLRRVRSLWPHGLQHARLPCPSPTPRACSNSCSLSRWCHTPISFSVISLSSCLQSFPASGSFPMNQFFASGGQTIGASASVLLMNIQY